MEEHVSIPVKGPKGETNHKVFSVRLPLPLLIKINDIAARTNQSRNEVIRIFLEHSVHHFTIESPNKYLSDGG